MGDNINIEQLKEFLEFRILSLEERIKALEESLSVLLKTMSNTDNTQNTSLAVMADRINLILKVSGVLGVASLGVALTALGLK